MGEHVIIIEQRLRTKGLILFLMFVTLIVIGVVIALPSGSGRHATGALADVGEAFVFVVLFSVMFLFLRVTVRVVEASEGRILEVVYGPWGLVRQVFGPHQLLEANVGHFSFLQMGGWGYRGSLTLIRRAALATRQGDALDVHLTRKRRFIVTVDDPADFVAALALPGA